MANTRELRRRIRSVKNTSQITKAMQMVAATKMRRAQSQALNGRPYSETLSVSLANLIPSIDITSHPLLQENDAKKPGLILLSTDKSLCGALNTNLFRAVLAFTKDKPNMSFFTVGKKGRDFVVRTGHDLVADFENAEVVNFTLARQIAKMVTDEFLKGELKQVFLAFPFFASTLNQEPRMFQLLPIQQDSLNRLISYQPNAKKQPEKQEEYIFEPNTMALLDFALNHFLESLIYSALLETKASEHAARMIAMQNATQNAQDLADDLSLSYNQIRQNSITQELLEITTAGMTLE